MCFTETHLNSEPFNRIDAISDGWSDVHKPTAHGIAFCYNTENVKVILEYEVLSATEMLPLLIQVRNENILLIIVYRTGPIGNFINDLMDDLSYLPTKYRTFIVGDFNLDQMLEENVQLFQPLINQFNFIQRSRYSTHIHGGILDLVFDNSNCNDAVSWIPSPYSDHFILFVTI